MNNSAMIVALVAVAISLLGIGFLFFAYINLSSSLTALEESASDNERQTKSELEEIKESLDESKLREMQIQEDLSLLRQTNNDLIANQTLFEQRISFLQTYIVSLEERIRVLEGGTQPPYVGTFSPVAQWSFDDIQDIGHDSSDNGNEMALHNGLAPDPENSNCRIGGCLSFDGADDYALVGRSASIEPTRAITVSAWVYPTSRGTFAIVDKPQLTHSFPFYSYNIQLERHTDTPLDKLRVILCLNTGGGFSCVGQETGEILVDLNSWHLVTMTYDGSALRGYVDGQFKASLLKSGNILYYDRPLMIGKYSNLPGTFSGYLDEVRIYDRALSNDEIIALYNNPAA